jgi:hypothetical protein
MDKLILSDSFDFGTLAPERLVSLLDVSRRTGADRGQLAKRAAVLTREIADVRPEPGTSVLHVIAMGASEDYGPNKNADGYKRAMLERDHPTFVTDARAYKEHDNDDVKKASGTVPASAYNPDMRRVELLVRVDDGLWEPELRKLASGGDITVSMSCHVPYDVCAICGNRASRRADYCRCMRKFAGRVLDDGRLVHVDNPRGRFFDISAVRNRADRIAFGLRKVAAAAGPVPTGAELFDLARGVVPASRPGRRSWAKRAELAKLSEIEKHIDGVIRSEEGLDLSRAFADQDISVADAGELRDAAGRDLGKLLKSLGDARISLPLKDFARVALGGDYSSAVVSRAGDLLPGIFTRLLEEGDADCCDDSAYDAASDGLPRAFSGLLARIAPILSLADGPARGRITRIVISGGGGPEFAKRAAGPAGDPEAAVLAREYAKYKLALFDKCANDGGGVSPLFYRLGVLQNYCKA